MDRLVTRIGNEPAVPTELDMDFAFDLDKRTFDGLQRIFNQLCDLTDILGDDYDLDRLKELVQADREGRCAKLPCKEFFSMLGGDVYAIDDDEVLGVLLCGVGYDPDGIDFIDAVYAPVVHGKNLTKCNPVDEFICFNCGAIFRDVPLCKIDEDSGDESYYEFEFKFCPRCGMKVDLEDDE